MDKYTEANKRLAIALGWTEIKEVAGALLGTPPDGAPGSRGQAMVPDWCGDWSACGPLIAKHSLDIFQSWGQVGARPDDQAHQRRVPISDCGYDRDFATRCAIVKSATAELEAAQ